MKRDITNRERDYFGLFDPLFDDFFGFPMAGRRNEIADVMRTDVREVGGNYVIDIELPGYSKENISMELENGYLKVVGKKDEQNDQKDEKDNYIRRERRVGTCTRSFYVGDIEEDDVIAKLENGILSIEIPKESKKIEQKKKIEIK